MSSLYVNKLSGASNKIPVFIYNNSTGKDRIVFIHESHLDKTHIYAPFTKPSGSLYLYRIKIPAVLSPFSAFIISYTSALDAVMFPINAKNMTNIKHISLTKKLVDNCMRQHPRRRPETNPAIPVACYSRLAISSF